ncbi:MAG: glutamine synthetase, partial [Paracoccaceae bacterium]
MTLIDQISAGKLASAGVYDADAVARAAEIVERVGSDGYETIRLMFPDQHGILRGKTIVARGLSSAFASGLGVPSTLLLKDTSHRTAFPVWTEDVA